MLLSLACTSPDVLHFPLQVCLQLHSKPVSDQAYNVFFMHSPWEAVFAKPLLGECLLFSIANAVCCVCKHVASRIHFMLATLLLSQRHQASSPLVLSLCDKSITTCCICEHSSSPTTGSPCMCLQILYLVQASKT